MEVLQWAIGILVTIDLAITGFLAHVIWAHVTECKHINARMAGVEKDVERMKEDIGTHDSGLRGHVHHVSSEVTAIEKRLYLMEHQK